MVWKKPIFFKILLHAMNVVYLISFNMHKNSMRFIQSLNWLNLMSRLCIPITVLGKGSTMVNKNTTTGSLCLQSSGGDRLN